MILRFKNISAACALSAFAVVFLSAGCVPQNNQPTGQTEPAANATASGANNAAPSASPMSAATPAANDASAANLPVTLPVLDAMFADEKFAGELKSKLGLSDEQVQRLQQTAREATSDLSEDEENRSTSAATKRAQEQIREIIGEEKSAQLARLVSERWETGGEEGAKSTAANGARGANAVPSDTRIVVNAPAYRMDLFKDGQLVRSYKVGIGYPEFPLPTGTRQANTIIFNPTWTPPDEPWVKGKVKPGEKVEAGSKLNPLGPIKIPIGSPSLIHGGKNPARLGTFASHGCVGLTNPQVQDFAIALAQLSGTEISEKDVLAYEKAKTETKNVKLSQTIPVELRYETIVVEDGKLRVYRDVYERGTNTEENLRRVLEQSGVSFDSLNEQERGQALDAVKKMAVDAGGQPVDPSASPANNANSAGNDKKANQNKNVKETKTIKGQKEIVVEIAALKGKGYPAPVDLNTGGKSKKPLNLTAGGGSGANNSNSNRTGANQSTSNAGQAGNENRTGSRKF